MADKKISDLTILTAAEASTSDELVITDISNSSATKKITVADVLSLGGGNGGTATFTLAADTGIDETLTTGTTLTIGGQTSSGISTAMSSPDTYTIVVDTNVIPTKSYVDTQLATKIEYTSLSVSAEGTASGDGSVAYNNSSGAFTYTPPVLPTASSLSVDDLITLSGVVSGSAHLGTFTGSTITDDQDVKAALQLLETSHEAIIISYVVTVTDDGSSSQNVFVIDGIAIKTSVHVRNVLHLQKGVRYRFDQADATNGTHPLRFSTTADGTWNSGSDYTGAANGVTVAGTPGYAGAYTEIEVKQNAPDILFIYCANHAGMGGGSDSEKAPVYTTDHGGWCAIIGNRTASHSERLIVDSSAASRTITLPVSPAFGNWVRIIDGSGNIATNAMTVARNGSNINGNASDMIVNTNRVGFGLVYYEATNGWILIEV